MRKTSVVWVVCSIMLMAFCAGTAFSQDAAEKAVTLADILKAASCPLTADQTKKLAALDLTKGREAFQGLNEMFDEKQTAALKAALGARPGRDGGPESPRYLMQMVVFEKAKCPLTAKQLAALKALPNERGAFQQMNEILTDPQKEAMQKVFPRRQGN